MSADDQLSGINSESKEELNTRVLVWKKVVSGIAVGLVVAYLFYFGLILNQSPAHDPDKWGTFGDFVGGLMNPIVAFAAFFWLTESVKLQKQELAETRAELKSAAEAQQTLAKNGRDSVRLAALTAVSNATQTRIDLLGHQNERISRTLLQTDLTAMTRFNLTEEQKDKGALRTELLKDMDAYFGEMREILDVASGRPPVVVPGDDVTYVK